VLDSRMLKSFWNRRTALNVTSLMRPSSGVEKLRNPRCWSDIWERQDYYHRKKKKKKKKKNTWISRQIRSTW